ncbi:hypothetical protein [Pseudorhodoplanes sp.]|uniref:hypothetical protein n=1 Tax=Pseudorhodoplanes sp. TaxID=1934341 RepID=UPI003D117848
MTTTSTDLHLNDRLDDIARVRHRVYALRTMAVGIELEGDKPTGQALCAIIEDIDDRLKDIAELLDEARPKGPEAVS